MSVGNHDAKRSGFQLIKSALSETFNLLDSYPKSSSFIDWMNSFSE